VVVATNFAKVANPKETTGSISYRYPFFSASIDWNNVSADSSGCCVISNADKLFECRLILKLQVE